VANGEKNKGSIHSEPCTARNAPPEGSGSGITPERLSELAKNSGRNDGFERSVDLQTALKAAAEFTETKIGRKVGFNWEFISRCSQKKVRITRKSSGLYQANFETFDILGNRLTNYHVNIH